MIRQAISLFRRFWPHLACLYLLERAIEPWILRLCVEIGFINRLLGLSALAVLVLLKLVVLVWMFHIVRPGLLSGTLPEESSSAPRRFTAVLAVVLVPFFAYYAAWGFLGDVIRDYSLLGLRLDPFGEHGVLLKAGDSRWLLVIVAATWLLRKACDELMRRQSAFTWRLAATLLSANWVFIGLYALTNYKEQIQAWLARLPFVDAFLRTATAIKTQLPAITLPGFPEGWDSVFAALRDLFFFVLLPWVWFALAAMIYNRRIVTAKTNAAFAVERVEDRYARLPTAVRKVLDRLIGGYRSRYLPIARSVELTLTSGIGFLLLFVLSYRAITWGSGWLWIGAKHLIGPYSQDLWFVFADVLQLLIGSPLSPERGVIFEPLRICLLAAAFDQAVSAHGRRLTEAGAENAGTVAARPA
jgi:hypothetical protein